MEGYLNDYAKNFGRASSGSTKEETSKESYIQLRDYYSSQAYFDDLELSIRMTFKRILPCGVLSEIPSMIY